MLNLLLRSKLRVIIVCFPGDFIIQTSSLSSDMVGIPTADEFMKHKEEFDAKIDSGSDDLNAGLLSVHCCTLLLYLHYSVYCSLSYHLISCIK